MGKDRDHDLIHKEKQVQYRFGVPCIKLALQALAIDKIPLEERGEKDEGPGITECRSY